MFRLSTVLKHLAVASLVLFLFACGGGGCGGGCASCGLAPIPGGFPTADRIPNAAQVRLTESGIDFVEMNRMAIVNQFIPGGLNVPVGRQSASGVTICTENEAAPNPRPMGWMPQGDCGVNVTIDDLQITPMSTMANPGRLSVRVRLVVKSADRMGNIMTAAQRDWGIEALGFISGTINLDTTRGPTRYIEATIPIDLVEENPARPARGGFTKIVVGALSIPDNGPGSLENEDINGGGFLGTILNALKGILIGQLRGQITGLVNGAVGDNLCTKRVMTATSNVPCPTGTFPRPSDRDGAVCRYANMDNAECVPTLLGLDGQGDLGATLIGGFSPGTSAPAQILLAAGGNAEGVNNGVSIFMYGGFRSTDRTFMTSPGHNPCVPVVQPPPIPTIARANAFRQNTIPGTAGTTSHVGIGVSEKFLNYAGYGLFDSGALCIGANTRLSQQLSTGLLSALIGSTRALAFPSDNAPVALTIRPQEAPVFAIGTTAGAPLLTVTLPRVEIDFYVWSTERYVRFMTYKADLVAQINLSVMNGQIVPTIVGVTGMNSTVINSELISEDPVQLAMAVESVLGLVVGMLGDIGGFDLPAIMGFNLIVPPEGIRGVDDSNEKFLGIFANLALAPPGMLTQRVETRVRAELQPYDARTLQLATLGRFGQPEVRLTFEHEGPAGVEYEYSYRLDGQTWQPWTRERSIVVRDRALLLQARHQIEAVARVVGEDRSQDASPATAEVLIDHLAPDVELSALEHGYRIDASDIVSGTHLRYRHRVDGGAWTEWTTNATVPEASGSQLQVEVQDDAGNVAGAQQALIRGLPNASAAGGCGSCSVPGDDGRSAPIALALLGGLFGVLGLRRRRLMRNVLPKSATRGSWLRVVGLLAVPFALSITGCNCGGTAGIDDAGIGRVDAGDTGPATTTDASGPDMGPMIGPPLQRGLMATHLDMALGANNRVLLSGYSPGNPPGTRYGDLVFGEFNNADMTVNWTIVDGLPATPVVTNDPTGWRGGVRDAGPNVGLFTSIATRGEDVIISYYDVTRGALKVAIRTGGTWTNHTVDDAGDSGRYTSLVLQNDGRPAVAYMRVEPNAMMAGRLTGSVRVARANVMTPTQASDWTISEVASQPVNCRPTWCAMGEMCLENGQCVTTVPMGQTALPTPYIEDLPPAIGLYNSLAKTANGLALAYYDRTRGNVYGSAFDGTAWGAPFLIDGYAVPDTNPADNFVPGDCGVGTSLFVDAMGAWHVTYVDGSAETLRYARVMNGTAVTEVVDNGASNGAMRNPDGRHVIGDDSSILVTSMGELRVVYQDATSGTTMLAKRPATGGMWTVSVLDGMDHSGYWLEQVLSPTGGSYIAGWWRALAVGRDNGVRVKIVD